jgi:single-strand DNA-binding protein
MDQGLGFVVGRLTRDPKFFGEGDKQRALFSVAYNRGRGDNRKANFIDCIAWGKRADIMRDFSQGMGIFVTGDLDQDSYEKDGKRVNHFQLIVSSITATTSTRRPDEETSNSSGQTNSGKVADSEEATIPF